MTNITINAKNHTIEMNKTTAKAASIFGSEEYNALQAARRDYPTYRVVTVAKKNPKSAYKGLTCEYIEKYIEAHDDEEKSIMAEYKMLTGKSEAGKDAMADPAKYALIKEWFFMTFPEIEKYNSDRENLIKKINERIAAKQAAKTAA
ncbi:MAG: hypothetical protein IJ246_02370 [Clostridia bacterium]|nr:hypothetical protein [Clostridia bacterium]